MRSKNPCVERHTKRSVLTMWLTKITQNVSKKGNLCKRFCTSFYSVVRWETQQNEKQPGKNQVFERHLESKSETGSHQRKEVN